MMKNFMKKIAITAIVCVGSLAPYSVYGSHDEEDKIKGGERIRINTTQAPGQDDEIVAGLAQALTPLLDQQPRDLVQLRNYYREHMLGDEAPRLVRMLPQGAGGGGWPPRPDPRLFEAPDFLTRPVLLKLDDDDFKSTDTALTRYLNDFKRMMSEKCESCYGYACFSMRLDDCLGFKLKSDNESFLDDKNDSNEVRLKRSQFEKLKIFLLRPKDLNAAQNTALFSKLSWVCKLKVSKFKHGRHWDENIPLAKGSEKIFAIIPRDVLSLICSYLPAEDLLSVFQVNKQFAATAGLMLQPIRDRIINKYHNPRGMSCKFFNKWSPSSSSVIQTWLSELPSELESALRPRLSQIIATPTLAAFALRRHELRLLEEYPSAPDGVESQPEDKE